MIFLKSKYYTVSTENTTHSCVYTTTSIVQVNQPQIQAQTLRLAKSKKLLGLEPGSRFLFLYNIVAGRGDVFNRIYQKTTQLTKPTTNQSSWTEISVNY